MTIVFDASIALNQALEEWGSDTAEELLERDVVARSLWCTRRKCPPNGRFARNSRLLKLWSGRRNSPKCRSRVSYSVTRSKRSADS